ncbi:LOW QUALITY PROTEIN: uncharacterized protein LOC124291479 [Haliotis rubra]|uniref:LOW QUALITY PROTEIN: uncharacterized protein LOC124291479 n=1 Tax=Haliotis rubra TaxID=36100 RepID=UPI001EE52314|nr:LOW QUALITY PROTEIN: uncharacterized protein LOC124291479 [Haliotis rubra]
MAGCKRCRSHSKLCFLDFGIRGVRAEGNNLTSEDIMEKLAEHVNAFLKSDYCCFAAAILSHGENGGVLGTDGNFVVFKEIKDIFGDHLITSHTDKPKLFFIQGLSERRKVPLRRKCLPITSGPFPLEAHFYWSLCNRARLPSNERRRRRVVFH